VSDRRFKEALAAADKGLELSSKLYGPRSKRLASKYYQRANCLLSMRKPLEAVASVRNGIDIFENFEEDIVGEGEEKEKVDDLQKDRDQFNRVQYQNFLCSSLFIAQAESE
jgi:hypothetical protein